MPYDEALADKVRALLQRVSSAIEEKKMFGGLCFMVNGKMCVGVESDRLMVRFNPALAEQVMKKRGAAPMAFTGKPMKGYVFVDKHFLTTTRTLSLWVALALDYNQLAKAATKKKVS